MTLRHAQAHIFHGDNLKNWPREERDLLEDVALYHVLRCQHPKCKRIYKHGSILNVVEQLC